MVIATSGRRWWSWTSQGVQWDAGTAVAPVKQRRKLRISEAQDLRLCCPGAPGRECQARTDSQFLASTPGEAKKSGGTC